MSGGQRNPVIANSFSTTVLGHSVILVRIIPASSRSASLSRVIQ